MGERSKVLKGKTQKKFNLRVEGGRLDLNSSYVLQFICLMTSDPHKIWVQWKFLWRPSWNILENNITELTYNQIFCIRH